MREELRNSLGGILRPLRYGSLDINDHPIDTYSEGHGFGPFESAWSPWEFADPASDIDVTYNQGSNNWDYGAPANLLTLFSDPTTDHTNQVLAALNAQAHTDGTGGWVHDILGGIGQGVLMHATSGPGQQ